MRLTCRRMIVKHTYSRVYEGYETKSFFRAYQVQQLLERTGGA